MRTPRSFRYLQPVALLPLACTLAGGSQNPGGAAKPDMLVSTSWLAERLADPSLVILHTGSREDYDKGHVPGARLLTLGDISITGPRGLRLELPPVEALRDAFGKLGISDSSRIVIYPAGESVQSATRVWFTLDYLGLGGRASLLDGGLMLWRAEGRPVSTEAPTVEPRTFTAQPRPELVVDADWVRSHTGGAGSLLLDARTPEFYTGASAGSMPRAGRIPGARNVPYTSVLEENRKLKPEESLRAALAAAGVQPGKTVVTYCHIGQQATVLYFLARHLGFEARLYDGSYQDWSARTEFAVEK